MTEASQRKEEVETFILAYAEKPNATEDEFRAIMSRIRSNRVRGSEEETDVRAPAPATNGNAVVIHLPRKAKNAYKEVVPQITDLLRKPEICDGFNVKEKSLVQSVITVLESGIAS